MNIRFEQFDAANPDHNLAAKQISNWSYESSTMRTLYPQSMADFPYSILAFSGLTGNSVGHIAVTSHDPYIGMTIIGGYVVNPDYRGYGIGREIVSNIASTVLSILPDIKRCAAKANELSLSQFTAVGGNVVRFNDELGRTQCGAYMVDLTSVVKSARAVDLLN